MAKRYALGAIALIAVLVPLLEVVWTGTSDFMGRFAFAHSLLLIPPIYWWYHVDKVERQYQAGPLMNIGVVSLFAIVLPIYFVKSRGWQRGALSIFKGIGVLIAIGVLGAVGAMMGNITTY